MDFCVHCEKEHGTLTLYRRYNAYGTAEIINAVMAAGKAPAAKRSAAQTRLLVEAKPVKEPETNEELIQKEIARREMARRRLIYFTTTFAPGYKPGWVHQDIGRRLERFVRQVEAGAAPRLILALPPRHGKSLLASDIFPSWALGLHPDWGIIGSSHSQSLPLSFSRNIRDRIREAEYKAIFPQAQIRKDAQGIEEWWTTQGGGYIAAGIGTGINGKGMMIGILDDALKDAEAAASEVIRNSTFAWYRAVFRTRLAAGGGILIIATRWHHDDPTGRVLAIDEELTKGGVPPAERENWELVSYPAVAEHDEHLMRDGTIVNGTPEETGAVLRTLRRKGEALHAERWPLPELMKLKNTSTRAEWSALFQQAPTPDEGEFFKRDDFVYRWLDPVYRSLCRIFMTVDYAIGQRQRHAFTAAGAFALDAADDLYVLEIRRGRWGTQDIVQNIVALVERHQPEFYAGERGQIHMAVWPTIQQALDKKRFYVSVDETLVPIQDKEVRARPLQGRTQRRKLIFSYDSGTRPETYDAAEREMLQFPNGKYDDIVDMLSWAARLALNLSLPNAQIPTSRQTSWKDTLSHAGRSAPNYMAA